MARSEGNRPARRIAGAAGHAAAAVFAGSLAAVPAQAGGGIFKVIHPEVDEGGLEFEALNTYFAEDVPSGEERSVHEIALGVGVTSWWKTAVALEIANPEDETAELEGFEWENVLLLWGGKDAHDHDHDHGHDHGHGTSPVFGLYAALEIPNKAGIDEGALAVGPIGEVPLGDVTLLGNLLVEFPFTDGEDPGLSYALAATMPVAPSWKLGLEAHGDIDEAFGDAPDFDDQSHYLGPAIYNAADLGRGRLLETRLAVLPGLTDDGSRDLALSLNAELKF